MRRVLKTRPMLTSALQDEQATQDLKEEAAYNIIAQSVTNWESLDRRYEDREPFKSEYDFNYDHRLTLAVQQRMFSQKVEVAEDEIKQYYEQNKSRYSVPTQVELYIIDETQGPIDQVWADFAAGKSVDKVFQEYFEKPPKMQKVPANHLDPDVKAVVSNLSDGETSSIFTAQGIRVMVHLLKRSPETVIPFERVKDMISQDLQQKKIKSLEKDFLNKIRANSEIEIDQDEWQDVRKELGGA
jgi:parvulin-like peptidyl-prolyl isomerase